MYNFLVSSVTTTLSLNLNVAKSNSASLCFRILHLVGQKKGVKETVTCQFLYYGHRITLLGGKFEYNTTEKITEYVIKRTERTQRHTHLKQNVGQDQ
jgi:hypothetical protein